VAAEAERLDEVAASSPDVEIALEWWAARARHVLQANAGASTAERVLTALSRLMSQPAPVDVVGQAYSAGAELAAHAGDGERNLQIIAIARDCHRQIVEVASPELVLSARQLPWSAWLLRHSSESPLRAEQVGEIERLVKD